MLWRLIDIFRRSKGTTGYGLLTIKRYVTGSYLLTDDAVAGGIVSVPFCCNHPLVARINFGESGRFLHLVTA